MYKIKTTTNTSLKTQKDLSEDQINSTKRAYDKYAKKYSDVWEWDKFMIRKVQKDIISPFIKYFSLGNKILVLGCGTGRNTMLLEEKGLRCINYDYSPSMIKLAKKNVKSTFIVKDIRENNFGVGIFSGAFCESAFEHIPKMAMEILLKDIYHSLMKNSTCLFGFKKGDGGIYSNNDLGLTRYFTTYSVKEAKDLAVSCGYKIIKVLEADHGDLKRPRWINIFCKKS